MNHIYLFLQLFFKAGVIGALEDLRDDTISKILISLQTQMRFNLSRTKFVRTINERNGATVIQSNWRSFQVLKNWPWQMLLFKIKPLLNTAEKRKEMDELLEEYEAMKKELEATTKERKRLEAEHQRIIQLKNNLMNQFAGENDAVQDAEDRYESLLKTKAELQLGAIWLVLPNQITESLFLY